jgi:aspartyl-tRNA(Asn)/glutamyl-tRNA(Gln) amidotransferase subunit A
LPLSLQLVGHPFAEATVYRVAAAYEAATRWPDRHPGGLA